MEDIKLKRIQDAISRQRTNNYPQIFILDMESGNVFEYGKNCHDRLVVSGDGRSLHYANLQNGDGSRVGSYRFYYEKPVIETEMDKVHEFEIDYYARHLNNKSLQENQALKDRWQKLKEFVAHQYKEELKIGRFSGRDSFFREYRDILDKMQELEKE
mgnify:CR=1 FL=1